MTTRPDTDPGAATPPPPTEPVDRTELVDRSDRDKQGRRESWAPWTGLLSYLESPADQLKEQEPVATPWTPVESRAARPALEPGLIESGAPEPPSAGGEEPEFSAARAPARRVEELVIALEAFRRNLTGLAFPLRVPGAEVAEKVALALAGQIDDYLIPRLHQLDAPILAVFGGSTGAGKSTLVNSLVGAPVTRAGVLRPTTRDPVLICHPDDETWYSDLELLPRLARARAEAAAEPAEPVAAEPAASPESTASTEPTASPEPTASVESPESPEPTGSTEDESAAPVIVAEEDAPVIVVEEAPPAIQSLRVVPAPGLVPGIALLDAPDVDSVVAANRAMAEELLGAADLWLFVTTAARYADAVPWQALRDATGRGAAVALVLDRVPAQVAHEIAEHFGRMLERMRIEPPPLFIVPESIVDENGLLPDDVVHPIREWLRRIGRDPGRRSAVARQTLLGAASSVGPRAELLAGAAIEQATAARALTSRAREAYAKALSTVEKALLQGTLVRGEVLLRWRELAERDELRSALRALSNDWREKVTATLSNRPPPGRKFMGALNTAIATLITDAGAAAAEAAHSAWRGQPTGAALLRADDVLAGPGPRLQERATELVTEWEDWVLAGAKSDEPDKGEPRDIWRVHDPARSRTAAKKLESRRVGHRARAVGLLGLLVAVSPEAHSRREIDLLRPILRNGSVADLADTARMDLLKRIRALLDEEVGRFVDRIKLLGLDESAPARLRSGATWVTDSAHALARRVGGES